MSLAPFFFSHPGFKLTNGLRLIASGLKGKVQPERTIQKVHGIEGIIAPLFNTAPIYHE